MAFSRSEIVASFLPTQPFIEANRDTITSVFRDFTQDFPDRSITVDDSTYTTSEALRFDDNGELTSAARSWLWRYVMGQQHGYDRGVGDKISIPHGDLKYMGHAALLNAGGYNFVTGGQPESGVKNRNLLVGCGYPHLSASRLYGAVGGNYEALHDAHSVNMLTGQRRRWNDDIHEGTPETVLRSTAHASGLDLEKLRDQKLLEAWQAISPFAREEAKKPDGPAWEQAYATETEIARVALEIALMRAGGNLFDWRSYPVIEYPDETAEPLEHNGHHVPPRYVKAWEYKLKNGASAYIVNGRAVPRHNGGEPRPTSDSVMAEAYPLLAENVNTHENVIAFGAPHIRAAYEKAFRMINASSSLVAPIHLSIGAWEFHEPPISGLTIVDMVKADKRLRATIAGENPDSDYLKSM